MDYKEIEDMFFNDTKDHVLSIIRNDGVNRHIQFKKPGTICYGFDLITWPGHLCITGDCGTFVFRRIEDMFSFFRIDIDRGRPGYRLPINLNYWHEKVIAESRPGGCKHYSREIFHAAIKEYFDQWAEDQSDEDLKKEIWAKIEDEVLSADENGFMAMNAAMEFDYKDFQFIDFQGTSLQEFTYDYIWCCIAIVWGIQKYDEATK